MPNGSPRIIEYANVRWNVDWCKRCLICVDACPKHALAMKHHQIIEVEGCDRVGVCQKFCPDLAIEVIHPRNLEKQR